MAERSLEVRVFTHPACSGCGGAVRQAWELAQDNAGIEVRTVSLESREGLAEARAAGVRTIPTVILARGERELERWVGTPPAGALAAALATSRATG